MVEKEELGELLSSLRGYLEELRDSGVDGLPLGTLPVPAPTPPATWAEPTAPPPPSPPVGPRPGGEGMAAIRMDLEGCRRCQLGSSRTNLVFGVGSEHARLVFVGEAPGRDEDLQGEPFVGEAGQLLTKIIEAMGLSRREVYICNVLKCRPPGNRNPNPAEIEECQPFLLRQIRAISPDVIVALGTFAAQTLLETKEPISRLRGTFHDYHGIPLMPTFHPAFLLRTPAMKRQVWDDMQVVMKRLGIEAPGKKKGE